ncbi:RNA-guided endonuclease TnpB family protein [Streptomyces sp. NBC_01017]|uniref:RNA-guided endonuclease InsQ/TnpB family protein n=1 Tax=Streptomyces sp. NBC_01017 TaxID=2903721 RepID=UPI003870D9F3|nr:RNA-guided endonuclease TnpB family protein [Streptomyces sp. NBC_01017]WSV34907.1 RNA-guided endonuclease TnpB family protein [Streptomyces sp. NBC_01017]
MESTIDLFKTELIKPRRPWKAHSEVEPATAEWTDWYCHRRLHGEIGNIHRSNTRPTTNPKPRNPRSQSQPRVSIKPGTVQWRSKARWASSFRFPAGNLITVKRRGRKWGRGKLPKLGWVTFRWSRPLGGEVWSATVSRRGGHWFVSFLVNDQARTPEQHAMPGTVAGIDRGVKAAAVTSDGEFFDRPFITAGEAVRFRRLQQQLARTKTGSANRVRVRARMNKIMGRVTSRRADFCAVTAAYLTAKNALVVLEDLKTRSMTAAASGTLAEPGSRVAQKQGLNRAILDKGWHRLELALTSAARYTGTRVVKVNCRAARAVERCGRVTAADLHGGRNCLFDRVHYGVRLGYGDRVAGRDGHHSGADALGDASLGLGSDRPVLLTQHIPGGQLLPSHLA